MRQWSNKNRYELPGDPGFITRLFWAIEDYVRLGRGTSVALVVFALFLLWILIVFSTPGPL